MDNSSTLERFIQENKRIKELTFSGVKWDIVWPLYCANKNMAASEDSRFQDYLERCIAYQWCPLDYETWKTSDYYNPNRR